MDPKQVRLLEEQIALAIAEVLAIHDPDPPMNSRTTHLMAKAAVAVLEAVAETSSAGLPRDRGR